MQNRVFFPQAALDAWLLDSRVDLTGADLTILSAGRKYRLAEAVLITKEVTGDFDKNRLVGKVKSRPFLEQLGAELFETSAILGDNAYDVVPGWVGRPEIPFADYLASEARPRLAPDAARTDEELLALCLSARGATR